MKPLVSVIVPCYNAADYLPECMASLEKQTLGITNMELIFVDDASTDDGKTWKCIAGFEKKYPDSVVAVYLEENRRQGGARNVGLSYAQADYVGFVDADDWVEPEMYEKLYRCMREYGCEIADCRMVMNMPDGREFVYHSVPNRYDRYDKTVLEGGTHWVTDFLGSGYGGGIITGLYKKNIITDNRLYFPEETRYEDNYWQYILLLYIRRFYHLSDNCYHYRQNETSTVHGRNARYHLERMDIELKKVETYKELGIFERFIYEIEWDFLGMYYINTLYVLWTRFDEPPYTVFKEMTNTVKTLFPYYKENPYLQKEGESLNKTLIGLIDRNLNKQQFLEIGNVISEYQ